MPAGHTDLILAAVGEELGLVGLVAVFALYAVLGYRALRIALRAPGDYTLLPRRSASRSGSSSSCC